MSGRFLALVMLWLVSCSIGSSFSSVVSIAGLCVDVLGELAEVLVLFGRGRGCEWEEDGRSGFCM